MSNQEMKEILDQHDLAFNAFRRAEEQLDFALETNRSITKALRESRKARNQLLDSMMKANRVALELLNK